MNKEEMVACDYVDKFDDSYCNSCDHKDYHFPKDSCTFEVCDHDSSVCEADDCVNSNCLNPEQIISNAFPIVNN